MVSNTVGMAAPPPRLWLSSYSPERGKTPEAKDAHRRRFAAFSGSAYTHYENAVPAGSAFSVQRLRCGGRMVREEDLALYFRAQQTGEPRPFPAPKLTDVYRTPSMSTFISQNVLIKWFL